MAHGGTNFGFFSGANTGDNETDYKADLTSYDYVSLFNEILVDCFKIWYDNKPNLPTVLKLLALDMKRNCLTNQLFVIQDAPIKESGDVENLKFEGALSYILDFNIRKHIIVCAYLRIFTDMTYANILPLVLLYGMVYLWTFLWPVDFLSKFLFELLEARLIGSGSEGKLWFFSRAWLKYLFHCVST